MNRKVLPLAFEIFILIGCQTSIGQTPPVSPEHASLLRGVVVGVTDGDTVTVLDASKTEHKIRLRGIDAPEKAQAFGQASKKNLSDLIYGKVVTVEVSKLDRYGRELGKILLDGRDINLEQVRAGLAWHYKQYAREQSEEDRSLYKDAEDDARERRRGLWQDANPQPPWEFRRLHKKRKKVKAAPQTNSRLTCAKMPP